MRHQQMLKHILRFGLTAHNGTHVITRVNVSAQVLRQLLVAIQILVLAAHLASSAPAPRDLLLLPHTLLARTPLLRRRRRGCFYTRCLLGRLMRTSMLSFHHPPPSRIRTRQHSTYVAETLRSCKGPIALLTHELSLGSFFFLLLLRLTGSCIRLDQVTTPLTLRRSGRR